MARAPMRFSVEAGMAWQSNEIAAFREHLEALRNECRDVAEHVARSRQAIEHSLALLRVAGKIEEAPMSEHGLLSPVETTGSRP